MNKKMKNISAIIDSELLHLQNNAHHPHSLYTLMLLNGLQTNNNILINEN